MMKNAYLFISERLGFRNWTDEDLDVLIALNTDSEVMKYFPKTLSKDEVVTLLHKLKTHFSEHNFTYYATEVLATKEVIGMIGLAYQDYQSRFTPAIDIGWRLQKSAWGKGYATEGAKRCLEYAFHELQIPKVIAVCTLNNRKSEQVMKRIGMTKKGEFDHPNVVDHPALQRHCCYEICKH